MDGKKKRIAMIFPYAPTYRERIYLRMDEEFDVTWIFAGNAVRNLRQLDYSLLRDTDMSLREKNWPLGIQTYEGLSELNFDGYDAVITPTVIRNLSTWRLFRKVRRAKGRPRLMLWTHGWYGRESALQRFVKKLYYRYADTFLLYGNYARGLMEREGFEPGKLAVIYNSLDYDRQLPLRRQMQESDIFSRHFPKPGHNLIFIGRLTEEKRLDMIMQAMKRLQADGLELNLTLIGDGEMRRSLEEYVRKEGLQERVWFYGACFDEAENARLIYNADLCVSPGNIGLTAIHTMMFGTPCLSHDDFAHQGPEFEAIREGETGAFFRRGDADSLTEAIARWFKRPDYDRATTRELCFKEIDTRWNPDVQLELLHRLTDDTPHK